MVLILITLQMVLILTEKHNLILVVGKVEAKELQFEDILMKFLLDLFIHNNYKLQKYTTFNFIFDYLIQFHFLFLITSIIKFENIL